MAEIENGERILEDHLHQQYAENDNKRSGAFITFIVGIIALFGFYGYVYVNTNIHENIRGNWNFDIQEFLLMSFVTIGILFFLAILALYFGYSLRRDHFIVYNIRKKRYKAETEAETKTKMKEIFGKIYNPSDKCFCSFIPGFYNLFYWLFLFSEIFLHITAIIKIDDIVNTKDQFYNYKSMLYIIILFHFIFIISTIVFRLCYFCKYKCLISSEEKPNA